MTDNNRRIRLEPLGCRVTLRLADTILAETDDGQRLFETGYPMRIYLARNAIDTQLVDSQTRSHCPYKGDARYFHVVTGGQTLHDAAWSYPEPIESMTPIAGLVCFDHPDLTLELGLARQ